MDRRVFLQGLGLGLLLPGFAQAGRQHAFAQVRPGTVLHFPYDHGGHAAFRTEWWYATGWLQDPDGQPLGFQLTFFRVATGIGADNPSAFAPRHLILAHAAVADPALGRLRQAERSARVGLGRAGWEEGRTGVWVDGWRFTQQGDSYLAEIAHQDFAYTLRLTPDGPPMLNGPGGYSQKAPDPLNASHYYSRPQLAVEGQLRLGRREQTVQGRAWLDHEWSSEYLPASAQGWDWLGLNLDDGSALMVFRLRRPDGQPLWSAATLRPKNGSPRSIPQTQIRWTPQRYWSSPRSQTRYPVAWHLTLENRHFEIQPLMDDQELDGRRSTGALYWEGAVRLLENGQTVGRGYLELTGYGKALVMGAG